MLLDLEDERLRVKVGPLSGGRSRLVIDYPSEPKYRDAVLTALATLLRPAAAASARPKKAEATP